jgi:ribosomal protein L37AE/L43A
MSREDLITGVVRIFNEWRKTVADPGFTHSDGLRFLNGLNELRALSPAAEGEQDRRLREMLTCRNGAPHYCPNCDNSIDADRIIKLAAEGRRAPILKPLDIIDGRVPCPKCGEKGDLIAAQCDAEAPQDVWECPACRHQWLTGAEG